MNQEQDRDLLARIARLPRSIEPPEDLWPDIAQRISSPSGTRGVTPSARARAWWTRPPMLAAAAILLVTLSSTITALVLRHAPGTTAPPLAAVPTGQFRILEAEYARAADELVGLVQRGQRNVSPATRAILERNLAIIDHAIDESRTALARDPGNSQLEDMILANYQLKLDLLRRVAVVS